MSHMLGHTNAQIIFGMNYFYKFHDFWNYRLVFMVI